ETVTFSLGAFLTDRLSPCSLRFIPLRPVHGRKIISMDIPLVGLKNVLPRSSASSIALIEICALNLPMKVFWPIHSVEYIRSHLSRSDLQMAIKRLSRGE